MLNAFRDMDVMATCYILWQLQYFEMTIHLPRNEDYALTSQIRRSSNGVWSFYSGRFWQKNEERSKLIFILFPEVQRFETQHHLMYGSKGDV